MSEKRNKRVGPLNTALECRRELAKVYREARRGDIETTDAGRFANILSLLINAIRDTDLEDRVRRLETGRGNP